MSRDKVSGVMKSLYTHTLAQVYMHTYIHSYIDTRTHTHAHTWDMACTAASMSDCIFSSSASRACGALRTPAPPPLCLSPPSPPLCLSPPSHWSHYWEVAFCAITSTL